MAIPDRMYTNTGFAPIDDEHKTLSMALDDFVRIVNSGKVDETRAALDGLIHGIADHFAHEEEMMLRFEYPSRKQHKDAHTSFVVDLRKSGRELERGDVTPTFRRWAVARLPDWFRFHILAHDMGLGQFLLKAGDGHPNGEAPPTVLRETA